MSNERIDLTQFEGIEDRIKHCQEGIYPAEDLLQELALIAPNLIAELKRCYEMIDQARANLEELYEVTESSEVQAIARSLSQGDMEHTVNCATCLHIFYVPTRMLNRLTEGEKVIEREQMLFSKDCPKCSLDIIDA